MIQNVATPIYTVRCNNCNDDAGNAATTDEALRIAEEAGWTTEDRLSPPLRINLCPKCASMRDELIQPRSIIQRNRPWQSRAP